MCRRKFFTTPSYINLNIANLINRMPQDYDLLNPIHRSNRPRDPFCHFSWRPCRLTEPDDLGFRRIPFWISFCVTMTTSLVRTMFSARIYRIGLGSFSVDGRNENFYDATYIKSYNRYWIGNLLLVYITYL